MEPDHVFSGSVMGICFLGLMGSFWVLFCNERSFRQRNAIIDRILGHPNWRIRQGRFHSVSYRKHLWTLALGRDWRKLYPADLVRGL